VSGRWHKACSCGLAHFFGPGGVVARVQGGSRKGLAMERSGTRVALGFALALTALACGGERKKTAPTGSALLEQRPRALFVVGNATLSMSDEALRSRLVNQLGFDVDIKTGPASATSDADGKALVLVSESVTSADVTNKFLNVPAPVMTLEPSIMDDMKMTGLTFGADYGDAQNQQDVAILDAARGHPLAAGLSGSVQVTSAAKKLIWGAPGSEATKVATISGQSGQAAIYCYEAGANMVGAVAAGRRIGWFAGSDAAEALNANGWALFDAAVKWATGRHALLITAAGALSASDQALRTRMQGLGYEVEVVDGPSSAASSATGKQVMVVSESTSSIDVDGKFTNVVIPIVSLEPALFDDLGMTGSVWQTDFGDAQSQTDITITAPDHPLAAGLSGQVAVVSPANKFVWGKPNANAAKVATLVGQPNQYAVFGYEAGATMVTGTAPARRVGWFAGRDTPAGFSASAWALFEAAVKWAAQPQALLVVGALPLSPSDALLRNRLESPLGFKVEVTRAVDSQTSQATGRAVIVVSESSLSTDINTKFRDVATPVVTMEPEIYDSMNMTAAGWGTEIGDTQNQTQLNILDGTHPLADGLTAGLKTVTTAPQKFVWGRPSPGAAKVASIPGQTTQIAIFGYESGATMVGLTAPGRRVGFFPGRDTPAVLNATGLVLVDAAVRWASGQFGERTSACVGRADGTLCSDGNACNGEETCQGGICRSGIAPNCDDGNTCTIDSCDAVTGCRRPSAPDGSACTDGNACTQTDACEAGACVGSNPITCTAQDQCHDPGVCNTETGLCSNPTKPNGTPCSNANFCTSGDACSSGVCSAGTPVPCTGTGQSTSGTFTPAQGGMITLELVRLTIPPQSLSSTTTITITSTSLSPPPGQAAYTPVYDFIPEGLQFSTPATVSFWIGAGADRPAIWWSRSDGSFEEIGGVYQDGWITAPITHLSKGFVGIISPATENTLWPHLDCVFPFEDIKTVALFGYRNTNSVSVDAAIGANNSLSPGAQGRGQPTRFLSGMENHVFGVSFLRHTPLTWTLSGRQTTAYAVSRPCPEGTPLPINVLSAQDFSPTRETPQKPFPFGGRAVAISGHPHLPTMIAGTESGGLFVGTKNGDNYFWEPLALAGPDGIQQFHISDVKIIDSGIGDGTTIIIATTHLDSHATSSAGIWRSTDDGQTWTFASDARPAPGGGCSNRFEAYGISISPDVLTDIFVGTSCGLAISRDRGATWTHIDPNPDLTSPDQKAVVSVVAHGLAGQPGGAGLVDIYGPGGFRRSSNRVTGSTPFGSRGSGLPDPGTNALGISVQALSSTPGDGNVLLLVPNLDGLFESDDGGNTWIELSRPTLDGPSPRPKLTAVFPGQNPGEVVLYFGSVFLWRKTCSLGASGPRCAAGTWQASPLGHPDVNGIRTFPSGSACPDFITTDGGIERSIDCGATFSIVGNPSTGFNALQIEQVTGQAVTLENNPHTDLYFATHDNFIWASPDDGFFWPSRIIPEGNGGNSALQVLPISAVESEIIGGIFGGPPPVFIATAHFGDIGADQRDLRPWVGPPGWFAGPVLLPNGARVQWTFDSNRRSELFMKSKETANGAAGWNPVMTAGGQVVAVTGAPANSYVGGPIQSPSMYHFYMSDSGPAVARIDFQIEGAAVTAQLTPNVTPGLELRLFTPLTFSNFIAGVDPFDGMHAVLADFASNRMKVTRDGGGTWTDDLILTDLVTAGGALSFGVGGQPRIQSQVSAIGFSPAERGFVFVGTSQNGLFGSRDGGRSWYPVPGSRQIPKVTSFFFDQVNKTLTISSYGRGLWRAGTAWPSPVAPP